MDVSLQHKATRNLRLPTTNYNGTPIQITPAQQGDLNTRSFKIQLYDDYGNIGLSQYTTVLLSATRADDELFVAEGEILDGFIHCTLTAPMLAETGKVSCDITLTGKGAEGKDLILTSQTFYVYVARSQLADNDLVGSENYNILVTLIRDVRQMERMLHLLETGITDAESARLLAENQREANELVRRDNESERILTNQAMLAAESSRIQSESNRVSAEETRISEESVRVEAESIRLASEHTRISREAFRQAVETLRVSTEEERIFAENFRASTEDARIASEENRVIAEEDRVVNELNRQAGDANRQQIFGNNLAKIVTSLDNLQSVKNNVEAMAAQSENTANASLDIAEQAVAIANIATGTATEAVKLSADALANSVQAGLVADSAYAIANDANSTSQMAAQKADSVVARANSGEFKGDTGKQGEKGESGFLLPIPNSFFRAEVRDDGNLWIIAPDNSPNAFSIQDGNLILTIS